MLIKWKPEFAIDNGIIDGDHKAIIGALNSIIASIVTGATNRELLVLMDDLYELADAHFEREEHLQGLIGFPEAQAHKAEHRELLRSLERIVQSLRDAPGDAAPTDAAKLKTALYRWVLSHILTSDLKMQPYLQTIAA
jgi:hemerythrin-like metal-binding protein